MEELIHLNGTIDRIIYENIENGFYIFTLTHKQQSITVKGTVPSIKAGQEVVVTGKWITHPKFGKQFDAQRCAVSLPTNLIRIKKYLSSGIIKGIGPTYAQKLIDAFGIKVLEVIDNKPEKLKSVPGIGPKRIKQIISDDGVPIAKLSPLSEDYDNHFQAYALRYIQFNSFFLSLTMDELRKRFSKEKILEYFEKSVVFENENKDYLKRAIFAYWDKDYIVSSHLFIPLIESGIRELIKICGGLVLKPNGLNGYDKILLGGLLKNDQIFENVFLKSGHNVLFYFRLVLTEKLGKNLRNDFAHGFGKKSFLDVMFQTDFFIS
jgi:DNA-binding Lrp family transcriptional regulator